MFIWIIRHIFVLVLYCLGETYKQVGVYSVPTHRYSSTKVRQTFLISYFFIWNLLRILATLIFPKRGGCKGCCHLIVGVCTPTCLIKKIRFFLWESNLRRIFVSQLNTTPTMTNDKFATKIVKRFCKDNGILITNHTWNGLGDVTVRIISVAESDSWNYRIQSNYRVINFEITMKKTGFRFSEDRIPAKNWWSSSSRMRFFKNRKWQVGVYLDEMISKTRIMTLLDMATIPYEKGQLVGNITYKFID